MHFPQITSAEQLEKLVDEIGFLPFFHCGIPGYSLAECTAPGYWFAEEDVGAWQWREQVAAGGRIAYAKLFIRRAGFVSMEWYPELCNYRRGGYDFDARYEEGLASRRSKRIIDALTGGALLTHELKRTAGFGREGEKGFEGALTELQMQTYITVKEFEYRRDKHGKAYGWGVGRYALAEEIFGADITTGGYNTEPSESRDKIARHIAAMFPSAGITAIHKLIR